MSPDISGGGVGSEEKGRGDSQSSETSTVD